jgi:antirestriction protein ArdC
MTYNQAKKLGAQVRKGEKSTIAIFYKSYTKEVEAPIPAKRATRPAAS